MTRLQEFLFLVLMSLIGGVLGPFLYELIWRIL